MKKILGFFFLILIVTSTLADSLVLNNQAPNFINNKSKMAIQWATSNKEVEENNIRLKQQKKLNPNSLQMLTRIGKIHLNIPKNAEYFRVLVWSNNKAEPDFLTNWVDIVPKKTYTLNKDYLIPSVLISGMGC